MKVKTYVNEGYGIWTSDKEDELQLHLNEWYSPPYCYMDIGVRICKNIRSDKIFIYIPLVDIKITDLFDKLKDKDVACAIFNADCTITSGLDIVKDSIKSSGEVPEKIYNNVMRVQHQYRDDYVVRLSNEIYSIKTIERAKDEKDNVYKYGSLVTINISEIVRCYGNQDLYFRFRFHHPILEKKQIKKAKKYISNLYVDTPNRDTRINYMQRINELRSMPEPIRSKYGAEISEQKISKVMSMVAANCNVEFDDADCYKIRQLERELHEKYLPEDFKKDIRKKSIIVYQWKKENRDYSTHTFVFDIKMQRDGYSFKDFLLFMLLAFISSGIIEAIFFLISLLTE